MEEENFELETSVEYLIDQLGDEFFAMSKADKLETVDITSKTVKTLKKNISSAQVPVEQKQEANEKLNDYSKKLNELRNFVLNDREIDIDKYLFNYFGGIFSLLLFSLIPAYFNNKELSYALIGISCMGFLTMNANYNCVEKKPISNVIAKLRIAIIENKIKKCKAKLAKQQTVFMPKQEEARPMEYMTKVEQI